jgi:putative peptidoglycan lipid II flippase
MQELDSSRSVAKSATHFLTGTFISRFTGMVRDLSMAYLFGTSPAVAGFLIAFRLANLCRRLFGEGALLNGFIPFFEARRKENGLRGAEFFRDLFGSLSAILFIIVCLLETALIGSLLLFDLSQSVKQIIYMTMVMVPGLFFICLFGLSMALLQCERKFFLPGVAPVAFNIVWIAAVWLLRNQSPYTAMMGVSASVVLAFFLQWIVTVPETVRYMRSFMSWKEVLNTHLFTQELKDIVGPLMLGVIGVAAVQINSAVDVLVARFASLEGPAYLSYAHRLQQLPLALFGIAISSALMPPLTRAIKNDDYGLFRSLLTFGFIRTFSLLLPGTVAIFVLGGASVNMLYGRGVFSNISTIHTTLCLWGYGFGLVPAAFVLIMAPAFYARRDFWTPTLASLISVVLNLALNVFMVFVMQWGAVSIAVSTSITAFVNMQFLLKRLHVKVFKALIDSFLRVSAAALLAGVIVTIFSHFVMHEPTAALLCGNMNVIFARPSLFQIQQFIILLSAYGSLFLLFSYFFKATHVLELFSLKKAD